jgi:hypothetical protein
VENAEGEQNHVRSKDRRKVFGCTVGNIKRGADGDPDVGLIQFVSG